MAKPQAINPQHHGEVVQFPSNASYLKDRRVGGGEPPSGGDSSPPSGGGNTPTSSGGHDVIIATLETKIKGAFVWLGLLTAGFAGAFLLLNAQISSVAKDVSEIKASVAGESSALRGLKESVDRLDDKLDELDDNNKSSPGK